MTVADVPFDLVEAKLGAPTIRPGTVAKQDVPLAGLVTAFALALLVAGAVLTAHRTGRVV